MTGAPFRLPDLWGCEELCWATPKPRKELKADENHVGAEWAMPAMPAMSAMPAMTVAERFLSQLRLTWGLHGYHHGYQMWSRPEMADSRSCLGWARKKANSISWPTPKIWAWALSKQGFLSQYQSDRTPPKATQMIRRCLNGYPYGDFLKWGHPQIIQFCKPSSYWGSSIYGHPWTPPDAKDTSPLIQWVTKWSQGT